MMKLHKNLNIGSIFFLWSWTCIFPFIKAFQSFLHAYMKIIIVMFFFCLWMFTVHVICFAIEQYKNKQTREASLVMYKLLKKKKVYTWLYWTSLLQVIILWNVCQSFFHVQYLLLRKKTGTKNKFFFYYKWSLACDITQLLTIKWKILFPRKKKLPLECLCTGCICHLVYALCVKGKTQNLSCLYH